MRKRIPTWKLSPGLLKRRPWMHAGAHSASTHVAWAARVANRFNLRPTTQCFDRARLTHFAPRDVIRYDNRMETLVTLFDRRQWVRNAFK
jgi:hypothetical protein